MRNLPRLPGSFDISLTPSRKLVPMARTFTVYILASLSRRLYTGVTGDLLARIQQHRTAMLPSFATRYRITRLVYFEQTLNVRAAIDRESQIKGWSRQKKIELIESSNAGWLDLAHDWFEPGVAAGLKPPDRLGNAQERAEQVLRNLRSAEDSSE
jgi:putative endonuclease